MECMLYDLVVYAASAKSSMTLPGRHHIFSNFLWPPLSLFLSFSSFIYYHRDRDCGSMHTDTALEKELRAPHSDPQAAGRETLGWT